MKTGGLTWLAFASTAFLYFLKFSMLDIRYLFQLLKAHNDPIFTQSSASVRQRISMIYIKYCLSMPCAIRHRTCQRCRASTDVMLFGGFFIALVVPYAWYVVVACLASMWLPQIVYNMKDDVRAPLVLFVARTAHSTTTSNITQIHWPHRQYVIGTTACRTAYLAYFTINPHNFLGIEVHPRFGLAVCLYIVLQVLLLYVQGMHGGRSLLSGTCLRVLLPAKYDYHRPVPREVFDYTPECVICMDPIEPAAPGPAGVEEGAARQTARGSAELMLTPCNHLFHTRCLAHWMEHKMECPTCRGRLPDV